MFKYLIYRFGQFCVNHIPLKVSYRIAMFISEMQYYFSFRDRRAVIDNLKAICPENENLDKLAKEVFRNFGKYLVEFFRMVNTIDEKFVQERVSVKNSDNIQKVLDRGKGAIILTAHLGNWEMGAAVLSMLGYPAIAIALPHKERPVNNLFNEQRESRGVKVISSNLAIRKCLESLRNNEIIAVVGDRDFSTNGRILKFLGRDTLIPVGPAILACKTGAGIVPTFLVREENDTFSLIIDEPIYPASELGNEKRKEDAEAEVMKKYISVIEDNIRSYPTQWLMFRRFWADGSLKKQTEGCKS